MLALETLNKNLEKRDFGLLSENWSQTWLRNAIKAVTNISISEPFSINCIIIFTREALQKSKKGFY